MTEGGKNYKLDELIGYYLIYLHYINNSTNPNLYYILIFKNKIKTINFTNTLNYNSTQQ